jgi:hypothetical protein
MEILFINVQDIEALHLSDEDILMAVEASLRVKGRPSSSPGYICFPIRIFTDISTF